MSGRIRCHLFCRVIDNHGDLGVCWRLARQLRCEHGLDVTLLVDDLAAFQLLAPAIDPERSVQMLDGLTLQHWHGTTDLPAPADLVIEGFACALPAAYIQAMAAREKAPVWINLEYLSAEDWVEGCHRLPSTDPRTGLVKHFWFPGLTPRTGGLLREHDLIATLDAVDPGSIRQRHGIAPGDRLITLFCYRDAPLAPLLAALAADPQPTTLVAFAGKSLDALVAATGIPLPPGSRQTQGNLTLRAMPLLPHADFDQLLAAADLNLVRGEDSFVRAQWAGRPMLWHIYPQDEAAHLTKLAAFITRVEAVAGPDAVWSDCLRAWNRAGTADWPALLEALPTLTMAARVWRGHLQAETDLATQLMRFHTDQVESAATPNHPSNTSGTDRR